eukprot:TRINITY_DN655_c0_g1_i3.p6 TRINITY_DN655_c0_g1~~TRINITY_DN655_c0_g1_i3.p6  ORF type:complete len:110 (+),score=32.87 TRINITY_DN655_c0_g1_i3:116-445(+)
MARLSILLAFVLLLVAAIAAQPPPPPPTPSGPAPPPPSPTDPYPSITIVPAPTFTVAPIPSCYLDGNCMGGPPRFDLTTPITASPAIRLTAPLSALALTAAAAIAAIVC